MLLTEDWVHVSCKEANQVLTYPDPTTEVNYAQIEKELLAILFAVERFEQCVYGRPVRIQTDHRPLESIFRKSLLSVPKCLRRMLLRLQKFDLQVSYKKGTEMYLADTLSRAYRVRRNTKQVGAEDVLNIENMRGNTERELESINMIQYLPVSEATQTAIRESQTRMASYQRRSIRKRQRLLFLP